MKSYCGADCSLCPLYNNSCKGCSETNGCPFGKKCWIAKYIEVGGEDEFELFKKQIISEFNSLEIEGMPNIDTLYPLHGSFINLEYNLPNNIKTKFLDDNSAYLGTQVESIFNDNDSKKYFGLVADTNFLLVSLYEENGLNPELIIYKKR